MINHWNKVLFKSSKVWLWHWNFRGVLIFAAHSDTTVAKMLVGNKCDLENIRDVSVEEGKSLAEAEGLFFMETSALDSTNVKKAFEIVIREIYNNVSRKVLNSDTYKAELSVNRVSLVNNGADGSNKSQSYSCCSRWPWGSSAIEEKIALQVLRYYCPKIELWILFRGSIVIFAVCSKWTKQDSVIQRTVIFMFFHLIYLFTSIAVIFFFFPIEYVVQLCKIMSLMWLLFRYFSRFYPRSKYLVQPHHKFSFRRFLKLPILNKRGIRLL